MFTNLDEYLAHFDFDSAFVDWWHEVRPALADCVGEKQAGWIGLQILGTWKDSPTALAIAKDCWDDEMRINNKWS